MSTQRSRCLAGVVAAGVLSASGGCHTEHHGAHWSYTGETGPSHWAELDSAYAVAATGREQSPIDISNPTSVRLPPIETHYEPTAVDIVNNGHTVQLDCHDAGYLVVDGTRYTLAQLHFHSPSEHTIDGRHSDMEVHLVHKSDAGELAVIGIMLEPGARSYVFDPIWKNMPREPGERRLVAETFVDAGLLLPPDQACYRYAGSLTTPPCTEGVTWLVMVEPVELSPGQIEQFRSLYHGTNRPVQPLHDRTVLIGQ